MPRRHAHSRPPRRRPSCAVAARARRHSWLRGGGGWRPRPPLTRPGLQSPCPSWPFPGGPALNGVPPVPRLHAAVDGAHHRHRRPPPAPAQLQPLPQASWGRAATPCPPPHNGPPALASPISCTAVLGGSGPPHPDLPLISPGGVCSRPPTCASHRCTRCTSRSTCCSACSARPRRSSPSTPSRCACRVTRVPPALLEDRAPSACRAHLRP